MNGLVEIPSTTQHTKKSYSECLGASRSGKYLKLTSFAFKENSLQDPASRRKLLTALGLYQVRAMGMLCRGRPQSRCLPFWPLSSPPREPHKGRALVQGRGQGPSFDADEY